MCLLARINTIADTLPLTTIQAATAAEDLQATAAVIAAVGCEYAEDAEVFEATYRSLQRAITEQLRSVNTARAVGLFGIRQYCSGFSLPINQAGFEEDVNKGFSDLLISLLLARTAQCFPAVNDVRIIAKLLYTGLHRWYSYYPQVKRADLTDILSVVTYYYSEVTEIPVLYKVRATL